MSNLQWVKVAHLRNNIIKLDKKLAVLLIGTASVKCPTLERELFVKGSENGLFNVVRECHIVLNGIQTPKNEIEQAYLESEIQCRPQSRALTAWWVIGKKLLTTLARSPSSSLMTAANDRDVWSRKCQHLFIDSRSNPDVFHSFGLAMSRLGS